MAEKYGLEVLLCARGAPGSQNGQNSGNSGGARYCRVVYYAQVSPADRRSAETLALRYRDNPKFWGIRLVNEPKPGVLQLKLRRAHRNWHTIG